MSIFSQARWLTKPVGNNAFSWERRLQAQSSMKLWIPPVQTLDCPNFECGDACVFEDEDEHGVLQSCAGLRFLVRTQWESRPMVIVDNHNFVLPFWGEALAQGRISRGIPLLHLDQHKDMRRPERLFDGCAEDFLGDAREAAVQALEHYTLEETHVGNYIVPAQAMGLIGTVHLVTSELAMEEFAWPSEQEGPWVFNVDLDFFAPELDYIDFAKARAFVRRAARRAALITVATSPFFMDQTRAQTVLHQLFNTPD